LGGEKGGTIVFFLSEKRMKIRRARKRKEGEGRRNKMLIARKEKEGAYCFC